MLTLKSLHLPIAMKAVLLIAALTFLGNCPGKKSKTSP